MSTLDRGRRKVLIVIALCVALSLLNILRLHLSVGTSRLPTQAVRFALTLVLVYFLYKGHNWARILWGVLCLLAIVVVQFAPVEAFGGPAPALLLFAMTGVYGWSAWALFVDHDVRRFFARP